jgi:hypothetical protein
MSTFSKTFAAASAIALAGAAQAQTPFEPKKGDVAFPASGMLTLAYSTVNIEPALSKFQLLGANDGYLQDNAIGFRIRIDNGLQRFVEGYYESSKSGKSGGILFAPKKLQIKSPPMDMARFELFTQIGAGAAGISEHENRAWGPDFEPGKTVVFAQANLTAQFTLYFNKNWGATAGARLAARAGGGGGGSVVDVNPGVFIGVACVPKFR